MSGTFRGNGEEKMKLNINMKINKWIRAPKDISMSNMEKDKNSGIQGKGTCNELDLHKKARIEVKSIQMKLQEKGVILYFSNFATT